MLTIVGVILAAAAAVSATPATLEQITAACISYYSRGIPELVTVEGQALCRGLVEAGVIVLTPAQATALAGAGFSVPVPAVPAPGTPGAAPVEINQEAQSSGEAIQAAYGDDGASVEGELNAVANTDGPFTGSVVTTIDGSVEGDGEVTLGQGNSVSALIDEDVSAGALTIDQRFYADDDNTGTAQVDAGISASNVDNDGGEAAASFTFSGSTTGRSGTQTASGSAGADSAVEDDA